MATRSLSKPARATAPAPDSPDTWPILWRVVVPGAGSYDHDMVFLETAIEKDAREACAEQQRNGYPVRLERVSVGPLPKGSKAALVKLRALNPQNPGTKLRAIPGAWETRP